VGLRFAHDYAVWYLFQQSKYRVHRGFVGFSWTIARRINLIWKLCGWNASSMSSLEAV
jgi:hypothetical protein